MWTGICLGICGAIVIAWILTRSYEKEFVEQLNEKEHSFRMLYQLSLFVLLHTPLCQIMEKKDGERASLHTLKTECDPQLEQLLFWCKKLSVILLVLLGCSFLGLIMGLQQSGSRMLEHYGCLQRNATGEGEQEITVEVSANGQETETIKLEVPERLYTAQELEEKWKEGKAYIAEHFLGENRDRQQIVTNLYFMQKIPDSALSVSWRSENEELISETGKVYNYDMKESRTCKVVAVLSYEEKREELEFLLSVCPVRDITGEDWKQLLVENLEAVTEEKTEKEQLQLPRTLFGRKLKYTEPKEQKEPVFLGMGLLVAIGLWIGFSQDLKKQVKKHDEQMCHDYPELVNKFTLLLSAGMTIKGAWKKIVEEYEKKKEEGEKKRFAYEEWCFTWNEMENGVTEAVALEKFGQRIGLMPYLKFSTLLVQNGRKGAKGLVPLLEYEAMDAFENRKQQTKRLAEEAGTKLLVPMMIMLLLVMVIIMVPAMMSI